VASAAPDAGPVVRVALRVRGEVQGVGFRPFACHEAVRLGLAGFVRNRRGGVEVEAEGAADAVEQLVRALGAAPAPARVHGLERRAMAATGEVGFRIVASAEGTAGEFPLPPDLATCDACMGEVLDPRNRRHRHPFASCARCGPRYSALAALPWDRANTALAGFEPCARCRAEHDDPSDRRFHAQTLSCHDCGPRLRALGPGGKAFAVDAAALAHGVATLRRGGLLALLGLGGFQLLVDARDEAAVRRLRERKGRPDKPLALLVRDARAATALVVLGPAEREAFTSAAGPIVLARRRHPAGVGDGLAPSIAPGVAWLGVMRPTTALHRLLADDVDAPLVATSGNRSGEPLCARDDEALEALADVADAFLSHDRPVLHPIDDSVVRTIAGHTVALRCGRGLAPRAFAVPAGTAHGTTDGAAAGTAALAALGGDLKAAVAVTRDGRALLGAHIGDLETLRARDGAVRDLRALAGLAGATNPALAADAHPDGHAGRLARELDPDARLVHHHHAHVLSCVAEHGLALPVLGVAWDGSGFGGDDTVWGGELLRVDAEGWTRLAHLRRFRLPGGERAVREPRRAALGLLHARFGARALARGDQPLRDLGPAALRDLGRLLERGRFAPETSSAGRLFDAVAALLGVRQVASYEGQAALELESLAAPDPERRVWPMALGEAELDWAPLLDALLAERDAGVDLGVIATRFHRGLACGIVAAAQRAARATGIARVVLTGGCFQNALLSELAQAGLAAAGLEVWAHRRVPPNDGGIALGQIRAMAADVRHEARRPLRREGA